MKNAYIFLAIMMLRPFQYHSYFGSYISVHDNEHLILFFVSITFELGNIAISILKKKLYSFYILLFPPLLPYIFTIRMIDTCCTQ